MKKSRLEAFSDGVLAIVITIMVLELKIPHGQNWSDLNGLFPVFLSYVISFIYVGIYWNNHHHMLHAVESVSGPVLWANLHLLFWLSLFPFVTGWVGENHLSPIPTALYGMVLFMAAIAFWILQQVLISQEKGAAFLAKAIGTDWKGKLSPVAYLFGIGLSFVYPWMAAAIYIGVALVWLVPDRRIEKKLPKKKAAV